MKKVLKFSASWCAPCKALSKTIANAGDKIKLPIQEIDIDVSPELAKQYQIRGVPTLILIDDTDGVILNRVSGSLSEGQLLDFTTN